MIFGFKPKGNFVLPEWAGTLKNYYWVIRVESRDKDKRRKYYRWIAKEKLRLVETGIDYELIKAVCKYLSNLGLQSEIRLIAIANEEKKQLKLDFRD